MTINLFFFAIALFLPTTFTTNDKIDVGTITFNNEYDNLSGSIDIYYSFGGTPSAPFTIQINTLNENLVSHEMNSNDFYSGQPNPSSIIGGNIYKYSFDISNINHTTTYYISLVANSNISYTGNNLDLYVIGNVNNFESDYYLGYSNGVTVGYNEGFESGKSYGITIGLEQAENFEFNLDWLTAIFQVVTDFLNVEVLPGFKIGLIVFVPLALGLLYKIFELLR